MDPSRLCPPGRGARGILDSLTVLGFLLVLAAPTLDLHVRPDDSVRSPLGREMRAPAPLPDLPRTLEAALAFPKRYEEHHQDSFGLRDRLLRWNSIVKVFGFGVSPTPKQYFGRGGWLFFGYDLSKENHRGVLPFSPGELAQWADVLERKRATLETLGARYLYVVAPDKESVYAELLPGYMRPVGPTRLDQLVEYLKVHAPRVEFLDLRAALEAAKQVDAGRDGIYTRMGTHWTGTGARAALRAMLARMNELAGGFAPEELDGFRRVELEGNGDSAALGMYIPDLLPTHLHRYVPPHPSATIRAEGTFRRGRVAKSEIERSARPRAILMHDSFGSFVDEALAEQCSYLECRWDRSLPVDEIAAAAPAILVDLFVERQLNLMEPSSLLPGEPEWWPRRFEESTRTLLAADASVPDWGLRCVGGTTVGPPRSASTELLPVTVGDPLDALAIGKLEPVEGEVPVLHVSIDSPETTVLVLWYRPDPAVGLVRRHAYSRCLVPGSNELYVPLSRPGTRGELLLRPGTLAGTYGLRELEIRSVRAP